MSPPWELLRNGGTIRVLDDLSNKTAKFYQKSRIIIVFQCIRAIKNPSPSSVATFPVLHGEPSRIKEHEPQPYGLTGDVGQQE